MEMRKKFWLELRIKERGGIVMATGKEEVIRFIEKLPNDYSLDDIMAELYFKQQVEQGLRDADEGRVYSHEQIKGMVLEWRKSSGRL